MGKQTILQSKSRKACGETCTYVLKETSIGKIASYNHKTWVKN